MSLEEFSHMIRRLLASSSLFVGSLSPPFSLSPPQPCWPSGASYARSCCPGVSGGGARRAESAGG
eukprot:2332431-Rhodomonas_salina.1